MSGGRPKRMSLLPITFKDEIEVNEISTEHINEFNELLKRFPTVPNVKVALKQQETNKSRYSVLKNVGLGALGSIKTKFWSSSPSNSVNTTPVQSK